MSNCVKREQERSGKERGGRWEETKERKGEEEGREGRGPRVYL